MRISRIVAGGTAGLAVVLLWMTTCRAEGLIVSAYHHEAIAAQEQRDFGRAKRDYSLAMKEALGHPSKTSLRDFVLNGLELSSILIHEADYKEAEELLNKLSAMCHDKDQANGVLGAEVDGLWAESLIQQGKFDDAETHLQSAISTFERSKGHPHSVAFCLTDLARVKTEKTQLEAAEALARRAIEFAGDDTAVAAISLVTLANVFHAQQRDAEALALAKSALRDATTTLGDKHLALDGIYRTLGNIYASTGDTKEAEQNYRKAVAINRLHRHKDHHLLHASVKSCYDLTKKTGQVDKPGDAAPSLNTQSADAETAVNK